MAASPRQSGSDRGAGATGTRSAPTDPRTLHRRDTARAICGLGYPQAQVDREPDDGLVDPAKLAQHSEHALPLGGRVVGHRGSERVDVVSQPSCRVAQSGSQRRWIGERDLA